jgi:hypothetical protein
MFGAAKLQRFTNSFWNPVKCRVVAAVGCGTLHSSTQPYMGDLLRFLRTGARCNSSTQSFYILHFLNAKSHIKGMKCAEENSFH